MEHSGDKPADADRSGARAAAPGQLRLDDAVNRLCPWTARPVSADALTLYGGAVVGFATAELRDQFVMAVRQFEDALAMRRAETAGNSE